MRVLWVSHVYPRWGGDMFGGFLHHLARAVADRGHDVMVVAPWGEGAASHETIDNVHVRRFRYPNDERRPVAYSGEMHRRALCSPLTMLRFTHELRKAADAAAEEWKPDVVHAHWWIPTGFALRYAKVYSGPRVISLHGTDVRLMRRVPLVRHLASWVLKSFDLILPVSAALCENLPRVVQDRAAEPFPMPADSQVFMAPDHVLMGSARRGFLIASRLTKQKCVSVALHALALAKDVDENICLTVVGDGPELGNLKELAASLDLRSSVTFAGFVSASELADLLQATVALVVPSVDEGYGLTIVEAGLMATPAIGTRSGGIPDIISHEENGLLVAPRAPEELAMALLRLTQDSRFARSMGKEAQRRSARRTAGPLANRLVDLYIQLDL